MRAKVRIKLSLSRCVDNMSLSASETSELFKKRVSTGGERDSPDHSLSVTRASTAKPARFGKDFQPAAFPSSRQGAFQAALAIWTNCSLSGGSQLLLNAAFTKQLLPCWPVYNYSSDDRMQGSFVGQPRITGDSLVASQSHRTEIFHLFESVHLSGKMFGGPSPLLTVSSRATFCTALLSRARK